MMNLVSGHYTASEIVEAGFPPDEGERLAAKLLNATDTNWEDLTIDLRGLPSGLLISAFFNAFLQEIYDRRPNLLKQARTIKWRVTYDFQEANIKQWMSDFAPFGNGNN
jgi:hypothetical protein